MDGFGNGSHLFRPGSEVRLIARVCRATLWLAVFTAIPSWLVPARADSVPAGRDHLPTVPLLNVWTLSWNADRAAGGFGGYWDAPIFADAPLALGFSEPQPATLATAPAVWLGASPGRAFGWYVWAAVFLNGAVTWAGLRRLGLAAVPAAAGGVLTQVLPLAVAELSAAQLLHVWPLVGLLVAAEAMMRKPSPAAGAAAGAFFGLAVATCLHHALMAGVLAAVLLPAAAWRWGVTHRRRWRAVAGSLVAGAAVAAAVSLPVVLPVRAALDREAFERREETVAKLSARPAAYARQPASVWDAAASSAVRRLRPGALTIALAVAGVFAAWRSPRRWWTVGLVLLLAASAALSFGANLRAGPVDVWGWLRETLPGVRHVRNVYRFAFFAQVAAVLLACESLQLLWRDRSRRRRWLRAAAVLLAAAAVAEVWPPRAVRVGLPVESANAAWAEAVREGTPPGGTLLHLPMGGPKTALSYAPTARWMVLQRLHGVPLVNGYSGFFPREYWDARAAFADGIQPADVRKLRSRRVAFIAVTRGAEVPIDVGPDVLRPVDVEGPVALYRVVPVD